MKRLLSLTALLPVACIPSVAGTGVYDTDSTVSAVKAAIILPFNAGGEKADVNYMDFYSGALLAAKHLQDKDIQVSIKAIDHSGADEDSSMWNSCLKECDFVIGPVAHSHQKTIAGICLDLNIPFVSPMDKESAGFIPGNRIFFQIPASSETQVANLIKSVKEGPEGPVTVIYGNRSEKDRIFFGSIVAQLDRESIPYRELTYEVRNGRDVIETLRTSMALPEGQTNKIIIASEDVAFSSDAVRNMALLIHAGIPVSVYGSPLLRNYNTIDSEMLYTVNFHTSTPYYVDYQDDATMKFILDYRSYFNVEPTPYSYQGYDLLTYFATVKKELGDGLLDYVQYYPASLLQNSIRFRQMSETVEDDEIPGGWFNTATRNIEYCPDGSILLH